MFKFSVVSETTPGTSTMAVLCSGLEMATLENDQLWALKEIQQGAGAQVIFFFFFTFSHGYISWICLFRSSMTRMG